MGNSLSIFALKHIENLSFLYNEIINNFINRFCFQKYQDPYSSGNAPSYADPDFLSAVMQQADEAKYMYVYKIIIYLIKNIFSEIKYIIL